MERIWLKNYPAGVAHEEDASQYKSLTDLLERALREHEDSPFSVCMNRWMRYKALNQQSTTLGAWLQSKGLPPGSRVAIMLPNLPQFAVKMSGVLRAGCTCVNVNSLYTARELQHQLQDSGATAIVVLENFAATLQEVLDSSGEICIRDPNVMVGYYKQPEENAKTFTADGFMRTGDIGIMDEGGYTRIVDRKKDMIIVSVFNVFPNELENVISTCTGVVECAAVGMADEMQGEAIKVFVVRKDPLLTEKAVARFCHDKLTCYKRPQYIEFRDELPKTNVGKILRRELRSHK
jgi:acyl-CoA synthetase (AMP-forming)/AMP-acid ligase II